MVRTRAQRAVGTVTEIVRGASSADELFEDLAEEIHRTVPHDGAGWFGVDPVTLLAAAPSRVENLDPEYCSLYWHLEFHEQDFGNFTDLARSDGAKALRLSLDDRPARSVRYREFMVPSGFEDELRAAFRHGDSVWGVADLYRESASQPFTAEDVEVFQAISGIVAAALRDHVRTVTPWLGRPSAPGLLVIDDQGRAVSSNAEAQAWLRDLWPCSSTDCGPEPASLDLVELRDCAMAVPTPLYALAARARAVADGRERVPARLRLRDQRGRWLVLHASALSAPVGDRRTGGTVAIVIEAAKSAEVAPIVIEAYSLTPRERDVLAAIARGESTAEIAAQLFLSPHTVRDYVKTVFEKVGVSSRNELVARLFGEHYSDPLHATMVHVD
ncbi:MAG: LuxR C-terminal-related transcriptional regulator [Acidimicrobiia bacterium]|jgi:DNA-binding CsgD family transcriptional regulator